MKIIEAMKMVKENRKKVADLQAKISQHSAHLSHETPLYGENTPTKIKEWAQSCEDLSQESIRLLTAVSRTNLVTNVTIEVGGQQVTKTIAEWVWRKREFAETDLRTWFVMTDRGLKEGKMEFSTGTSEQVKLVRNYDPELKDKKTEMYRAEPGQIDATLEIVNAVTELIE